MNEDDEVNIERRCEVKDEAPTTTLSSGQAREVAELLTEREKWAYVRERMLGGERVIVTLELEFNQDTGLSVESHEIDGTPLPSYGQIEAVVSGEIERLDKKLRAYGVRAREEVRSE